MAAAQVSPHVRQLDATGGQDAAGTRVLYSLSKLRVVWGVMYVFVMSESMNIDSGGDRCTASINWALFTDHDSACSSSAAAAQTWAGVILSLQVVATQNQI